MVIKPFNEPSHARYPASSALCGKNETYRVFIDHKFA